MSRRKVAVIAIAFFLVLLTTGSFAFQNEPEGFRGNLWGDPPTKEMTELFRDSFSVNYFIPGDKKQLGNASFSSIGYTFFEDKFSMVSLIFAGEENYDRLLVICEDKFGQETRELFYDIRWVSADSFVRVTYDLMQETGSLSLGSMPLAIAKDKAIKAAEAEKAAGDW